MPRPAVIAVIALAFGSAAIATGCGDDESATVTEERTVTTTEPPPTETEAPTTTEELPDEGVQGPDFFSTPSRNIACHVSRSGARCDIRRKDWASPPEPASCELDYGQGLFVGREGAEFVCAGDTTLGAPTTLAYGSASQRGRFLCESEESGVTCTDVRTGAGFFISRETYRIF